MPIHPFNDQRIVFFAPEAPPSFAGAGIHAHAFALYLSKYARQTILCCLNYNNLLPNSEFHGNLHIRRVPYYNKNFAVKIISYLPLLGHYFRKIRHADIILVYSGYLIGFRFIIVMASLFKKQIIFRSTFSGGDDPESLLSRNLFIKTLNKITLSKLTSYFSINPAFAAQFRAIFGDRIHIVDSFQGVDITRFYPCTTKQKILARQKLHFPTGELILFSAGYLLKKKGFHRVFPSLAKLDIPFRYIIAGDYTPSPNHNLSLKEKKEMETLYREGVTLLGNKIIFTGSVPNIEDYYHAADIFLLSSLQEGTPNVLLEAMACGLPCITTCLKGLSGGLVKHELNALEFDNFEMLPQIIRNLSENPVQMAGLGLKAYKTIAENYTFENVAGKLFKSFYGK